MPSNVENILNAILTGDGSGIQKPASRVEELLFEIYEQGGGGGGESVIGGIKLTIDENYVMTATLVDKDGEEYGVGDDIDLPLEEMVVDAEYDPQTQKIKLELKNGNYVEFSVAELVSGLQTELSSDNKLNPAYIDYDASHRDVSDTEKDTWNAKQNAISDLEAIRSGAAAGATAVQPATMSEALAAKQNSLSETQLAAVNSGINSTKVGQIETNQENILYAINTGVKNALVINDRETDGSGNIHFSAKDGIVTVTGTNGSNTSFFVINFTGISGRFKLNGCPSGGSDNTYLQRIYTADGSIAKGIDRGSGTDEFTLDSNVEYQFAIRIQSNYAIQNALVFRPMLYQADTDGSTFQTGSLPNHDLTRLEAEDRASLAEVVDSGAKNKIDIADVTTTGSSFVLDHVAISLSAGSHVFSYTSNQSTSGDIELILRNGTTVLADHTVTSKSGRIEIPFTLASAADNITLYSVRAGTYSDFMICTLAAWKVSQKFVPYRYDPYTTVWQNLANATLYARRNGRTVTINGYVDNLLFTSGTALTLGTINNEIGKPVQQIRALCNIGSNAYSVGEVAYLTVGTDGQLKVTPKTYSGTGAVFLSFAYAF